MISALLQPGVNVEQTPALNEAGISQSQLLRFKDNIIQTYGGWNSILGLTIPSTVKDLHAWKDTNNINWLSAAAISNLVVANSTSSIDITPQTRKSDFSPNAAATGFSISSGSFSVTITDPNAGPSTYDTVFFNTPISIGNLLFNGPYAITAVLSTGSYTITSSVAATITSTRATLPSFATTNGSPIVTVTLANHNFPSVLGEQQTFRVPTTVDGLTISGPYNITTVIDSTSFAITANALANASTTATMNASLAEIVYWVTLGPASSGSGFGAGGFGSGGYGSGSASVGDPGTPVTSSNWSQDNWGEILISCPKDGPIFTWGPHSGEFNAQPIQSAPFFNGGIFISMPQQILVAWKSTQNSGTQDNLKIRWSDAGDYTDWVVTGTTAAGSFELPTGSIIVGGMQAPNYGVIWTDVDVWIMQYVGGDVIFNFTRAGSGCGLIGQHAAGQIANEVYWCGTTSFFKLGVTGVQPIHCTVWDFIFQNLNQVNASKIVCAPNSAFNEISWFFPSINATECDSYVKYNIIEGTWDYGSMSRTAWTDVNVFGPPIGADNLGIIYQHEQGQLYPGAPVTSFRTGWWSIADGNEMSFVDWFLPDFIWSLYSGAQDAQVNVTLYAQDYAGDNNPRTYGPFTINKQTQYINPRLRGRLISMLVTSNNNVFWRLGRVRYRYAPAGRR
jgi:hypothetical protein